MAKIVVPRPGTHVAFIQSLCPAAKFSAVAPSQLVHTQKFPASYSYYLQSLLKRVRRTAGPEAEGMGCGHIKVRFLP